MKRGGKPTNPKSLLLVSRDGELKRQMIRTLNLAGLSQASLSTATRGQEGLELLARDKPRLLIVDDNLPDITGLDILRSLHRDSLKTLVIYMTTHHTLELERKVRQLGVLYYTEKPPEPAVMERVVATALASAGEGTRLRQPAKGLGRPPLV